MSLFSRFDRHPDELISASLTGDLSAAERRELEVHLSACDECRQTLESFGVQRALLSGLHQMPVPRDLGARVRANAPGRDGRSWWRRPGGILAVGGTLATVAVAALLAVAALNTFRNPPATSGSPSPTSSARGSETPAPSASPSSAPAPLGLQPGDMAYLSLTGPKESRKLEVINQHNGASVQLLAPASGAWGGAPQRVALSPDNERLAFAVLADGKGTWNLYVARLRDGTTTELGETIPLAFTDRILWSPDGRYLAYTIAPEPTPTPDVWLYEVATGAATQVTHVGNAYAASWATQAGGMEQLWISLGAANPSSIAVRWDPDAGVRTFDVRGADAAATKQGAFLPLISPDGSRATFWRGTMQLGNDGWAFVSGGLPYITAVQDGIPTWGDDALFDDLMVSGPSDGFEMGSIGWSADSQAVAFWGGSWPGIPEPAGYPDRNAVYVGRGAAGQLHLNKDSRVAFGPTYQGDTVYLVDVALTPEGTKVALTLGVPTPEFGATALLQVLPVAGDSGTNVGNPPAWSGPAFFVPPS